ncbi:serine hydrolase [Vibrio sonorensis]|uniref:serine hydrolase n=1 Tax=Vibrio sonorensis TaxID=1004316 RepID=UPI0008D96361|nr:serine hydrolase [Vibrio sonorensis]
MKCLNKFLIFAAWPISCFTQANALLTEDKIEQVDHYIQSYTDLNYFSGSVLVAEKGKVLLSRGYGYANLELDIKNGDHTVFRLASLTKQFTAMAIMQLQAEQKLHVDDTIDKFLPDYPNANKITIHQLLNHTSGIPDYLRNPSLANYLSTVHIPVSIDEKISRFKDMPLFFEPGEGFSYSNSGYVLLGKIIEVVTGEAYEQVLQKNIFDKLDMQQTGRDSFNKIIKHRADGYLATPEGLINDDYIHPSSFYSDGSLVSTITDLYKWDRAVKDSVLIPKELTEKMQTPADKNNAYGLFLFPAYDKTMIAHDGMVNGFQTYMTRVVEDDVTIIILSNVFGGSSGVISLGIEKLIYDQPVTIPTERKEQAATQEQLQAYIGKYNVFPNYDVEVKLDGERLKMEFPKDVIPVMENSHLHYEGEERFFFKHIDDYFTFVKDEKGDVTELIWNASATRALPAKKIL